LRLFPLAKGWPEVRLYGKNRWENGWIEPMPTSIHLRPFKGGCNRLPARRISFLVLFVVCLLGACHPGPRVVVETLPAYEAAFIRDAGWTGGDGAYSVALGDDRLLWLFGDTLIGRVTEGRRIDSHLIHNSAAIQTGAHPAERSLSFFYRTTESGLPQALFLPDLMNGWWWPYHGVRTPQGLFLFWLQIEAAEGPAAFGFRLIASWLAQVENPCAPPDAWTLTARRIPWGNERRLFGSSILVRDGFVYIYGTVDEAATGAARKQVVLARVPVGELAEFGAWRFYAGGEWVADGERALPVCDEAAAELSVSHLPGSDRYVMVYTRGGLSETIDLRSAPRPEGPWSEPVSVYRCPEADWAPEIFCYAAKAHPALATGEGELIVTYVTNSTDLGLLESDARLYRPRFIRVTFLKPPPDQNPR
jgi:hypothetical protein